MGEAALPYKLACLCDLRDAQGRVLLLHRLREPNKGLYSPIGGKLDMATGESPAQCARREIMEEAGIDVPIDRLHLAGLISERAYEGKGHWLLFYYRVIGPVEVSRSEIAEGRLEWHAPGAIESLPLPETDRRIIWPLIRRHEQHMRDSAQGRPGFFALHIDCSQVNQKGQPRMTWSVEQEHA
ncbi:MAG: NUDIX domain-containing protein [Phycisphaeraceae bacterium]|nr:NUDIX domain-containing protein [Phycisphaeraceae bacterium]